MGGPWKHADARYAFALLGSCSRDGTHVLYGGRHTAPGEGGEEGVGERTRHRRRPVLSGGRDGRAPASHGLGDETHGRDVLTLIALAMLPLSCVASVITALEDGPQGCTSNRRVDAAGYESDGAEEPEVRRAPKDESKLWKWRFSKSPLGEL